MSDGPQVYPVGIVGESNYQPAIRRCRERDRVRIVQETDNRFDAKALAVRTARGDTIGYIARDHWLQRAVHDEGRNVWASIVRIEGQGGAPLGVVLGVSIVADDAGDWVDGETAAEPERDDGRPQGGLWGWLKTLMLR